MAADRSELNDLSAQEPKRAATMSRQWEEWAARVKVFPKKKGPANATSKKSSRNE